MPLIFDESATLTADTTWEIELLDLSCYRELGGYIMVTSNASGGGSVTLDAYLESRDSSGIWQPRWHAAQLLGTALANARVLLNALQQQTALTNAAATSLGSTALAAGEVLNGYFPATYYEVQINPGAEAGRKIPAASWRFRFVVSGGSFPMRAALFGVGVFPYP